MLLHGLFPDADRVETLRGFRNVPSNRGADRGQQGRLGVQWDNSFFFDAAGRHQLKAGVQIDRIALDTFRGDTGNVHSIFWGQSFARQRGAYGYYRVISNPMGLRGQAGPEAGLRLGRHRRRSNEALRVVGDLLRHDEGEDACGFGGQYASLLWYTLDEPDLSGIENNPDCPPACPGDLILGPIDILSGSTINDPTISNWIRTSSP